MVKVSLKDAFSKQSNFEVIIFFSSNNAYRKTFSKISFKTFFSFSANKYYLQEFKIAKMTINDIS